MSFTTLYAELVVVGTGALIFILLLFYSLFGDWTWFGRFEQQNSYLEYGVILIPALSVIYLLGIVIANVSHQLFKSLESCLQTKALGQYGKYETIRSALYTDPDAEHLIADFEFRRSKVRICRGWFLNSGFIIIALVVCVINQKLTNPVAFFWIFGNGLLMIGTAVSWWTATTTELKWLVEYAEKLPKATSAKEEAAAAFICF
jgi:hypothetical protein